MQALNTDDLGGWSHHEEDAASLAGVVGVDTVVGPLFSYELERLMLAVGHSEACDRIRIYAFAMHGVGGKGP